MSAYVLELTLVVIRDGIAIGYGSDIHGHEYATALDLSTARTLRTAIDHGQRPIVAVEAPLYGRLPAGPVERRAARRRSSREPRQPYVVVTAVS